MSSRSFLDVAERERHGAILWASYRNGKGSLYVLVGAAAPRRAAACSSRSSRWTSLLSTGAGIRRWSRAREAQRGPSGSSGLAGGVPPFGCEDAAGERVLGSLIGARVRCRQPFDAEPSGEPRKTQTLLPFPDRKRSPSARRHRSRARDRFLRRARGTGSWLGQPSK